MYSLCLFLLCLVLIIVAVTSAWREPSLAPFFPRLLPFICQQQLCYPPGSSKPLMKAALFSTEISLLMLSLAHIQSERMWWSLKIDWALYITQLPKAFYTHDHWDNCKIILQGGTALLSPPFIWRMNNRKKAKTHEKPEPAFAKSLLSSSAPQAAFIFTRTLTLQEDIQTPPYPLPQK